MCLPSKAFSQVVPTNLWQHSPVPCTHTVTLVPGPYLPNVIAGLVTLFSLFPWSMLSKGFADLARAAEGSRAGISWQQRYSYCQASTPSPQQQAQLAYWTPDCTLPVAQALFVLVSLVGLLWSGGMHCCCWCTRLTPTPTPTHPPTPGWSL
jgi:hypothetical protein